MKTGKKKSTMSRDWRNVCIVIFFFVRMAVIFDLANKREMHADFSIKLNRFRQYYIYPQYRTVEFVRYF